jgi:Ca2+-binding RTX toxin-like protein
MAFIGDDALDDSPFSLEPVQYGLGGDDTLIAGSDVPSALYGGDDEDFLSGGSESDELFGERGNDFLNGDQGDDTIHGGSGDDEIEGQFGDDLLYGGTGSDAFVFSGFVGAGFDSVFDTIGIDRIQDFDRKQDSLKFIAFVDLGTTGPLDKDLFYKGKNASEGDDRIGYDKVSGKLYFDENGSQGGARHLIAVFDKGTALRAADIDVIG